MAPTIFLTEGHQYNRKAEQDGVDEQGKAVFEFNYFYFEKKEENGSQPKFRFAQTRTAYGLKKEEAKQESERDEKIYPRLCVFSKEEVWLMDKSDNPQLDFILPIFTVKNKELMNQYQDKFKDGNDDSEIFEEPEDPDVKIQTLKEKVSMQSECLQQQVMRATSTERSMEVMIKKYEDMMEKRQEDWLRVAENQRQIIEEQGERLKRQSKESRALKESMEQLTIKAEAFQFHKLNRKDEQEYGGDESSSEDVLDYGFMKVPSKDSKRILRAQVGGEARKGGRSRYEKHLAEMQNSSGDESLEEGGFEPLGATKQQKAARCRSAGYKEKVERETWMADILREMQEQRKAGQTQVENLIQSLADSNNNRKSAPSKAFINGKTREDAEMQLREWVQIDRTLGNRPSKQRFGDLKRMIEKETAAHAVFDQVVCSEDLDRYEDDDYKVLIDRVVKGIKEDCGLDEDSRRQMFQQRYNAVKWPVQGAKAEQGTQFIREFKAAYFHFKSVGGVRFELTDPEFIEVDEDLNPVRPSASRYSKAVKGSHTSYKVEPTTQGGKLFVADPEVQAAMSKIRGLLPIYLKFIVQNARDQEIKFMGKGASSVASMLECVLGWANNQRSIDAERVFEKPKAENTKSFKARAIKDYDSQMSKWEKPDQRKQVAPGKRTPTQTCGGSGHLVIHCKEHFGKVEASKLAGMSVGHCKICNGTHKLGAGCPNKTAEAKGWKPEEYQRSWTCRASQIPQAKFEKRSVVTDEFGRPMCWNFMDKGCHKKDCKFSHNQPKAGPVGQTSATKVAKVRGETMAQGSPEDEDEEDSDMNSEIEVSSC